MLDRRRMMAGAAGFGLAKVAGCATTRSGPAGWSARADLPWVVQEIYAAVWNGRAVTAGGLAGRTDAPLHIEDRVGLYDPRADAWSEGPRLPQPRHHPMIVEAAGALWAIGGYGRPQGTQGTADWTNRTEVWRLDRMDGAWAPGPALPGPQAEAVGLSLGGRIHLVTGRAPSGASNAQWNDQADMDAHRVLDPASGRWETARPAPMARNSAAGAVLDGALWIAGGRTVQGGGTGRLDRYDPAADRWDTLAPIPPTAEGRQVGGGLAMAALKGRLVAFGGEWFGGRGQGGGVFPETWLYDPARDAWTADPPMPSPRHGLAAVTLDGAVLAIAGGAVASGGRPTATVQALRL